MRTTRAKTPLATHLGPAVNRQPGYRRGNSQICSKKTLYTCCLHTFISFSDVCPQFLMHVVMSERSAIFSHAPWCFPLLRCCFSELSCDISVDSCCNHMQHLMFHTRCAISWCAPNIPHARGLSKTLCDTSLAVPDASHCCAAAYQGCLVVFTSFMPQSHATADIPHALRHFSTCPQHSLCTRCFPNAL